jgi:hypothetical protein
MYGSFLDASTIAPGEAGAPVALAFAFAFAARSASACGCVVLMTIRRGERGGGGRRRPLSRRR